MADDSDAQQLARASRKLGGARAGVKRVQILPSDTPIESLLFDSNTRQQAVQVLINCLEAKRTYYDLYAKTMVTEPDYATRTQAARLLLAYDVGEPVKRQQIVVHNLDSLSDLEGKLAQSPALCSALKKMLDNAAGTKLPEETSAKTSEPKP